MMADGDNETWRDAYYWDGESWLIRRADLPKCAVGFWPTRFDKEDQARDFASDQDF